MSYINTLALQIRASSLYERHLDQFFEGLQATSKQRNI